MTLGDITSGRAERRTQFDIPIKGEKDIVRFDVTMNDAFGMKMLQTMESL